MKISKSCIIKYTNNNNSKKSETRNFSTGITHHSKKKKKKKICPLILINKNNIGRLIISQENWKMQEEGKG